MPSFRTLRPKLSRARKSRLNLSISSSPGTMLADSRTPSIFCSTIWSCTAWTPTPSAVPFPVPSRTLSKIPCPTSSQSCSSELSPLSIAPTLPLAPTLVMRSLAACLTGFVSQVACRPSRPSSTDAKIPTHQDRSSSMLRAMHPKHPLPALNPLVVTATRGTTAGLISLTTSTTTTAGLCQLRVLNPSFLLVPLQRRLGT